MSAVAPTADAARAPADGWSGNAVTLAGRLTGVLGLTLTLLAVIILLTAGRFALTSLVFEPRLDHAVALQRDADDAEHAMLDQETGLRGYLLTSDPRFLQPYRAGRRDFAAAQAALADGADTTLTADVQAAQEAAAAWTRDYASPALTGAKGATADASLRDGKRLFDAYRAAADRLRAAVTTRLHQLVERYDGISTALTVVEALCGIGIAVGVAWRRRMLAKELVSPVADITAVLARITNGDLDARPRPAPTVELAAIATGISELADAVAGERALRIDRERHAVEAAATSRRLLELARSFATSLDPADVVEAIGHAVTDLADADTVTVWLDRTSRPGIDGAAGPGGAAAFVDAAGLPAPIAAASDPLSRTTTPTSDAPEADPVAGELWAAFSSDAAVPVGATADPRGLAATALVDGHLLSDEAGRRHVAVPLRAAGSSLGVVEVTVPAPMDNSGLDALQTLSLHAASALAAALLHAEVSALSQHDALTGLLNRRRHDDDLAHLLASDTTAPVAYVLADLDHFKAFNDRHGHLAGDELLRQFGRLLSESVRGGDTVYRYGGEEFALILPDTDDAAALALAERLRARVAAEFATAGVTASFGVAARQPGSVASSEWPAPEVPGREPRHHELVAAADAALYDAKRQGRDRVGCGRDTVGDTAGHTARDTGGNSGRAEDCADGPNNAPVAASWDPTEHAQAAPSHR